MLASTTLSPGYTFGRYEVLTRIASGGMAEVWLAHVTGVAGFEKQLVIKTMLPHLAETPDMVRLFIQEATLAARLNHPNLVDIFELGELDGRYFIAMEYVPGRTLRQISARLKRQRQAIPPWFLLRVIDRVCEGLQYAHDYAEADGRPLNLVHRDVSPENIMVSFTGSVKLVDFGVAKATQAGRAASKPNSLIGKYSYMSPEAVEGKPIDRRADIYALGIVLYEFLTGTRPFVAPEEFAILAQIVEGAPKDPRVHVPQLPDMLARIVLKAMNRSPAERYQEVHELAADLRHLMRLQYSPELLQKPLAHSLSEWFSDSTEIPTSVKKQLSVPPRPSSVLEPEPPTLSHNLAELSHADVYIEELVPPPVPARVSVPPVPQRELKNDVFSIRRPSPSVAHDVFPGARRTPIATERPASMPPPPPPPSPPGASVRAPGAELFDRGLELLRERQYSRAFELWKEAVQLEPGNRAYQTNLKRLQKLLDDSRGNPP